MATMVQENINAIGRILQYTDKIKNTFARLNIKSFEDLILQEDAKDACAQRIASIQEDKFKLNPSVLNSMATFDALNLKKVRNITAHEYHNINFQAVYQLCIILMGEDIKSELERALKELKKL